MSNEPEDMLEEALRGDLPTPDVEARVRRRLLAAGVAVGNGVATSTAAASGAGAAGLAVKASGLSWGLKLGVVALVGIPTVGLWLDGRPPRRAPAPVATPAQTARASTPPTVDATPDAPRPVSAPAPPATVERPLARAAKAPINAVPTPTSDAPSLDRPSQAAFGASEQPARTPQAASTLGEETRLLDAAFAALTAGNRAQAATLLQEHERRFPAGVLQHERERAKTRLTELSRGE